ncbi:MAG: conjugal transfer protein TraG, partial [Sulfobacillus sp.]|nr:conjugal transfer protein TraG [Sulfobacillus sp.]
MNRWWGRGARWAGWIFIGYWTLTVSLYLGARGLFPARPVDLSWTVRLIGFLVSFGFWLRDPRIRPVARIASVVSITALSPWA